jgi:hypothetical protein
MPFFRDINISSPEIVVILYLIFLFVFKMIVNHAGAKSVIWVRMALKSADPRDFGSHI